MGLLERPRRERLLAESAQHWRSAFYNSYIWKPRIPLHLTAEELTPSLRPPPKSGPIFNIDFGGTDGGYLSHLIRISAIIDGEPWGIIGLEFFYDNGLSSLYGRIGGLERTYQIDGPAGERVVGVDAECSAADDDITRLYSLKVRQAACFFLRLEDTTCALNILSLQLPVC